MRQRKSTIEFITRTIIFIIIIAIIIIIEKHKISKKEEESRRRTDISVGEHSFLYLICFIVAVWWNVWNFSTKRSRIAAWTDRSADAEHVPASLTTAWPLIQKWNGWKPKKREFFCHTMKLYNVNIYKEITFICGYYGENDLVNKVLVMFAHIWLCSHCSMTCFHFFCPLHHVCSAVSGSHRNQSYTQKQNQSQALTGTDLFFISLPASIPINTFSTRTKRPCWCEKRVFCVWMSHFNWFIAELLCKNLITQNSEDLSWSLKLKCVSASFMVRTEATADRSTFCPHRSSHTPP